MAQKIQNHLVRHREALNGIREMFEEAGEDFNEEDIPDLREDPPERPPFPKIMFLAALSKDILDAVEGTGIGVIIAKIFSVVIGAVIFLWLLNKGGGKWKGSLLRFAMKRFGAAFVIEMIPVLGAVVPAWTIFIILVHFKEKKVVQLFWSALDKLNGAGYFKKASGTFIRIGKKREQPAS